MVPSTLSYAKSEGVNQDKFKEGLDAVPASRRKPRPKHWPRDWEDMANCRDEAQYGRLGVTYETEVERGKVRKCRARCRVTARWRAGRLQDQPLQQRTLAVGKIQA